MPSMLATKTSGGPLRRSAQLSLPSSRRVASAPPSRPIAQRAQWQPARRPTTITRPARSTSAPVRPSTRRAERDRDCGNDAFPNRHANGRPGSRRMATCLDTSGTHANPLWSDRWARRLLPRFQWLNIRARWHIPVAVVTTVVLHTGTPDRNGDNPLTINGQDVCLFSWRSNSKR